jgi:hypothetical protein
MRKAIINVPNPSSDQVEHYLRAWDELENYHLQEDALDKLFFTLCPENTDMSDILLKVAALNDFYSTNIFSVYPVAKHILSLNIDDRLKNGDVALVSDIQKVTINGVEKTSIPSQRSIVAITARWIFLFMIVTWKRCCAISGIEISLHHSRLRI